MSIAGALYEHLQNIEAPANGSQAAVLCLHPELRIAFRSSRLQHNKHFLRAVASGWLTR